MLSNTAQFYTKLKTTFLYWGSPDVYKSGLTIETGNYYLCDRLFMQCYTPEPANSKGSFQTIMISGCRLQDSRLYVAQQSSEGWYCFQKLYVWGVGSKLYKEVPSLQLVNRTCLFGLAVG